MRVTELQLSLYVALNLLIDGVKIVNSLCFCTASEQKTYYSGNKI